MTDIEQLILSEISLIANQKKQIHETKLFSMVDIEADIVFEGCLEIKGWLNRQYISLQYRLDPPRRSWKSRLFALLDPVSEPPNGNLGLLHRLNERIMSECAVLWYNAPFLHTIVTLERIIHGNDAWRLVFAQNQSPAQQEILLNWVHKYYPSRITSGPK
jgi:hypothetical protein